MDLEESFEIKPIVLSDKTLERFPYPKNAINEKNSSRSVINPNNLPGLNGFASQNTEKNLNLIGIDSGQGRTALLDQLIVAPPPKLNPENYPIDKSPALLLKNQIKEQEKPFIFPDSSIVNTNTTNKAPQVELTENRLSCPPTNSPDIQKVPISDKNLPQPDLKIVHHPISADRNPKNKQKVSVYDKDQKALKEIFIPNPYPVKLPEASPSDMPINLFKNKNSKPVSDLKHGSESVGPVKNRVNNPGHPFVEETKLEDKKNINAIEPVSYQINNESTQMSLNHDIGHNTKLKENTENTNLISNPFDIHPVHKNPDCPEAKQALKLISNIKYNKDAKTIQKFLKIDIPKNPLGKVVKINNLDKEKITSNLIETLLDLVDYNEIIANHQQIFKDLDKNYRLGSVESKVIIDKLKSNLKCGKCEKDLIKNLFELNCNHIFCFNCLERELERDMLKCPDCTKQISFKEQSKIWELLGTNIKMKSREKLEQKYASEKQLKCLNCKIFKKNYYKKSCLHICKECFAEGLRNSEMPCTDCHGFINYEILLNETFICSKCKIRNYFVGSCGKYIKSEKYILCSSCANSLLHSGHDTELNVKLSKLEKIEINDHLFRRCSSCRDEIFKGYLQPGICGHYFCDTCQKSPMCKTCSSN